MRALLGALLSILVLAPSAHAQRYRVLVGVAGTTKMSLIEFSPCIPAETSACGAWINRVIDTASDSAFGPLPAVTTEQTARNQASAAIRNGKVSIRTTVRTSIGTRDEGNMIVDARRTATAVAITADARYAFAVFEAKTAGEQAMVRMIDFGTKSVIASIGLPDRPSGISIAP